VSDVSTVRTLAVDGSRPLSIRTVKDLTVLCDEMEDRGGAAILRATGTPALARLAGAARARRAVLFGNPIPASEALTLGIADEVTETPDTAVAAAVQRCEGLSGKELALRRQLLLDAMTVSFEDALGPHLAACDRALRRTVEEAA
jgi:enoyl-CoA hydratase/carnithine racemase